MYGKKVKLRFLFLFLILLVLILTVYLVLKSLVENVVYFISLTEIKELPEIDYNKKYRVDRSLYYSRDIKVDGLISAYDPDDFNSNDNQLAEEQSPGIFISDAGSQITNTLRSDFAGKTRSFSSDYNPWSIGDGVIKTTSFRVNINDLFFSTSIDIDLRRNGGEAPYANDNSKFVGGNGALGQTLADNFTITPANPTAYKLKMTINGEDFFIIMKKV